MSKSLPTRPDLAQLKKQAKKLHRSLKAGEAAALRRFQEHHPRGTEATSRHRAAPSLAEAQLVLAREYGFPSWPALAEHVDALRRASADPLQLLHQASGGHGHRFVMPNLFVIAGPNGAGKTTYARRFLPEEMRLHEFVNADMLARIERAASVSFVSKPGEKAVEEPSIHAPEENTRRAIRAMRKAFADAVLENLRYGLPVIQWRDGRVVEVPAEQLAPLARWILAANRCRRSRMSDWGG